MSTKPQLDPRSFPRPPKLEKTPRHLQIKSNGQVIADTTDAYWVLETYHPPTYYLPRSALKIPITQSSARQTFCEWKGRATYWDITVPSPSNPDKTEVVKARIWSYEDPTSGFKAIKDHLCFYAGPWWDCFVDGEKVTPQPGDFYGGWVTDEILGDWVKGAPGTTHWALQTNIDHHIRRMWRAKCLHRPLRQVTDEVLAKPISSLRHGPRHLMTLAIETSCDDTSVAVLEKHEESGHATLHFHEKVTADNRAFGGINPKIALVSHKKSLAPLIEKSIAHIPSSSRGTGLRALDFISVTRGPGIYSSVSTGLDTAKGLALSLNVPLLGVNHMQAHALTPRLVSALSGSVDGSIDGSVNGSKGSSAGVSTGVSAGPEPHFPFLSLLVSGGHTMVLASEALTRHRILANTVDVAAGDALDKMARLILPEEALAASGDVSYARALEAFVFGDAAAYDGYAAPERRVDEVTPRESAWGWALPVPLAQTRGGQKAFALQMSFAGLGSAVERVCQGRETSMTIEERRELGFEAMRITFEHIAGRTLLGLKDMDAEAGPRVSALVASGGVAANRFLRDVLRKYLDAKGYAHVQLHFPPLEYCTDNAAMIAWAGIEMYEAGWHSSMDCLPLRRWSLDPNAEDGGIFGVGGWRRRMIKA